nr:hypothetical protein [uncultured bacterium]
MRLPTELMKMRQKEICRWAAVLILSVAVPAFAHHSISVDYDSTKPITLTGKVTKVEWRNPHAFFYIDAKDPGKSEQLNWAIELGSLNSLIRLGWTQNSMKIGYEVTVKGILAIDGRRMINARTVTRTSTGERLLTWEGQTAGKN